VILERDENTLEAAQSLASHGLELLVLEIRSLKDCLRAFRILGKALGVPQAGEERAAGLKSLLKPRPPRGRSVLTLIWKDPWMSAGPGTYVGDLVRQTGNTPLGPDRYPVLSGADLRALDPDLILLPSEPYRFTRRDEAELAKSHPRSRVIRLDGRALTWYLSRSEAALEHLRSRLTLAP
jgi:ABC-type Fe3+-hydroxamate transport system substrate-binding protein